MQVNRRLYRCRENRVIAGVASGVAEFFHLDPTLVRILWFVSIFFGGLGIVLYLGLAIIVPLEPATGIEHPATADNQPVVPEGHRHQSGSGRVTMFIGAVLILFGSVALLDVALPDWVSWRQLWPVFIIGIGGLLIAGSLRRERESSE
jgi:phage shock protein PspC (stress-responsive transcriptional regulator)